MGIRLKRFFSNFTIKQIVFSLMAVVSFLLFLVLTIWSHHLTSQLTDQQAAQRWDKDGKSVQVSCYFTDQVKLTDMEFIGFKKKLEQMLKETLPADEYSEENDRRLVVDGYSAMGKVTVLSEKGKLTDVDAIGIGGDYFLFHPVKLLSGGYFTGEDLMQDSIILDTEGAWQLFGSNDIVGKSVMIGGVPHYVAGVIERDGSKFAKSAGLNKTTVYLSDDSLQAYGTTAGISNYEVLAPNPVRHFVYNAVKDQLGVAEDDMVVVENTTRFKVESLIPVILEFGTRSMQNAAIRFPFWENVARGYEDVCALILIFQFLFLLHSGDDPDCLFYLEMEASDVYLERFRQPYHRYKGWSSKEEQAGKGKNGRISDSRKERRTIMKKVIVSLLVVALVIGCFAGCGKKEKGDLQQQAVSRDYVYKQEVISYNGSGTAPSGLIQIGDKVYGYSYEWREMDGAVTPRADIEGGGNTEKEAEAEDVDTATEETVAEPEPGTEEAAEDIAESYSSMIFYEILEDGTFGEGHELQGAPDQSINSFAADSQGNLYCLRNVYVYDDGSDTSEDLYYLEQKTLDDETVFSVNLNELPENKEDC